MNEIVTNLRTIAAYNMQNAIKEMFDEALQREFLRKKRNAIVTGVASGVASGLQPIAHACAFLYARHIILSSKEPVDVGIIVRVSYRGSAIRIW